MENSDNRDSIRISTIKAKFVFQNKRYDIRNISSNGLLIACMEGFAEDVIKEMKSGKFDFQIVDTATESEMDCVGEFVRSVESSESRKTVGVALTFELKKKEKDYPSESIQLGSLQSAVARAELERQ